MALTEEQIRLIKKRVTQARELSYSPYSNFRVGCCILLKNGRSVTGANMENASYGGTVCAERTTIGKCITHENTFYRDPANWVALAIIGDSPTDIITPCGICRQVIREFVDKSSEMPILMFNRDAEVSKQCTIEELLPLSFGIDSMQ